MIAFLYQRSLITASTYWLDHTAAERRRMAHSLRAGGSEAVVGSGFRTQANARRQSCSKSPRDRVPPDRAALVRDDATCVASVPQAPPFAEIGDGQRFSAS